MKKKNLNPRLTASSPAFTKKAALSHQFYSPSCLFYITSRYYNARAGASIGAKPVVNDNKADDNNVSVSNESKSTRPSWLLDDKIIGRTKHYPPATKEWRDSVYSFNPNYMRSVIVKHNLTDKWVKSHFSIHGLKDIARSRRMRTRMIRFSTRKLIVSNPVIKHSSDKVNVTVYVFNREKQFYVRKLFFLNRKQRLYNTWIGTGFKNLNKAKLRNSISNPRVLFKPRLKNSFLKRNNYKLMPYFGLKFKNERDFLRYKLSDLFKKFSSLDKLYSYSFMCYMLTMLGVNSSNSSLAAIKSSNLDIATSSSGADEANLNVRGLNLADKNKDKDEGKYEDKHLNTTLDFNMLSNYLLQIIKNNFINTGVISYYDMNLLYVEFMKKKFKILKSKILRDLSKLAYLQSKMQVNQLKFTEIVPRLKTVVSRIFHKRIELNVVSLKHMHMNSDIFTQVIALKLRKKQNLLRVMKKSFNLVKLPHEFFFNKQKPSLSKYLELNLYNNWQIDKLNLNKNNNNDIYNNNGNKLDVKSPLSQVALTEDKIALIFDRLFPENLVNYDIKPDSLELAKQSQSLKRQSQFLNLNKNKDKGRGIGMKTAGILDKIKFKWVTGIRLEIAGRLTRRYKAARAVFKFKYRGNLKSKQYYTELGILKKMPTVMLRNISKVNTQYSFIKSKRRIGSFGIKNWISGY